MICIILLYKEIYGFCFGNAKGMWIKLLVEQVGDESRNPLSSSEIEIGYGILPLLSNTEFLSSLEFLKTETKLIDIWQVVTLFLGGISWPVK